VRALLPVRVHDLECLADRVRTIADRLRVLGGHHVHAHVHVDEWLHSDQHFDVDCHPDPDLDHDCQHVHAIGRRDQGLPQRAA
jgi:hypothetical protein